LLRVLGVTYFDIGVARRTFFGGYFFLLLMRANAISINSLVSFSVSGVSPSCVEKIGSNPVSLRVEFITSLYLLGIVGFVLGLIGSQLSWKCAVSFGFRLSIPYFFAISIRRS